jgi:hypothetical protein
VSRAGIRGLAAEDEDAHQLPALEVDDPRQARRQLAADLASPTAREAFLESFGEVLAAEEMLHKCLLPITVTVQVGTCGMQLYGFAVSAATAGTAARIQLQCCC